MRYILLVFTLALCGCKTPWTPAPPTPVIVSPLPGPSAQRSASLASAAAQAASQANEANPAGLPQQAVTGELGVIKANLPAPDAKDLSEALGRVNAALRGDLSQATDGWRKAEIEAAKLLAESSQERARSKAEIESREEKWKATYAKQDQAMRDAVASERQKAEAEMKRLIGYFFFGFSALCIVAGVACLTVLSGLGFVGPKVIAGCFLSAACLSGVGVLLIRALSSPWIGRGVAIAAVVALITLAFAYANHHNAKAP